MPIDALSEGDVVDGRYRLSKRLGEGGAGTVWLGRDLVRNIDVAVKILRSEHRIGAKASGTEGMVARFLREPDLAERMMSPHIVRVLARGITEACGPYIVYEHLEGDDLACHLAKHRRLSIVDLRMVIVHSCRALTRAHSLGVLHRDVKPANLLVKIESHGWMFVKMLDFGIAELLSSVDKTARSLVGTPEYIAPEVLFADAPPDARSDLYSLGVVAYECLTGRVPYPGNSLGEVVAAFAAGDRPPPTRLRSGLSSEIDMWFDTALHRSPDQRFATAKAMADAFVVAERSLDTAPSSKRSLG